MSQLSIACCPPGSELTDNSRFDDSPSPHAWSKHDAVLRVGIGTSEYERRDAFTVFKDGRVCTADGTVSRCGDEDGPAAASRHRREEVQADVIEELKTQVTTLRDQLTSVSGELADLKAQMVQVTAMLGVAPPANDRVATEFMTTP